MEVSIDAGHFRSKFKKVSVIRNKIWLYAFEVSMDDNKSDQGLVILKLLFRHFDIKNKDVSAPIKNAINNRLKTNTVKQDFEKLLRLLAANETNNSKQAEDDISQDNRFDTGSEDAGNIQLKIKKRENPAFPDNIANNTDKPLKETTMAQTGNKKKKPVPDASDLINVNNSGVVILHPFLKRYFGDLDLLADGDFINTDSRARAVLLLNYLATGEGDAAEFDLTLQKILCGYPLEDTLPSSIILTDKEKAESDNLLKAVIDHWEPLKNTSIAGFRGTFLQRNGNIELKESGWLLKVEQKTVDILLGKLPWGFSTIRLPWMQKMLSVDWY